MNISSRLASLKNFARSRTIYQWLWSLVVVWIVLLLVIKMFVPLHGHRTWWAAIFHRQIVKSQVVSPIAMTDDNEARAALLDFYQKYTTTTDKVKRQALVTKSSSDVFIDKYKNYDGIDPVTCSAQDVSSVQISDRILFNSDYAYRLTEYLQDNTQNPIIVTVFNSNGTYKIGNISCGQHLD